MSMSSLVNKVLVFLRLRKNPELCITLEEIRPFWNFQMFNIEDHRSSSRLVDLYYVFYRFFKYSPWTPSNAYDEVKYFIQRGCRGWSDRDVWGLDSYLSEWLPDALRHLKSTKHGVPCGVIDPADGVDDFGNADDTAFAAGEKRWDAIMDKMIAGFEADKRIGEGLYENELGGYPMNRPSGVSAGAWDKVKHDRHEAVKILTERDKKIKEEGLALFIAHYSSLWD